MDNETKIKVVKEFILKNKRVPNEKKEKEIWSLYKRLLQNTEILPLRKRYGHTCSGRRGYNYTIEDLDIIEGPDVEISELASRTHTYAGEVVDGEEVVARGLVEKVMKNGEFEKYRLLVGTTRESINEYIKLRESPVVDRTINQ